MRVGWALLLAGCVSEAECERRIDDADAQAVEDAASCVYEPSSLADDDCGGVDRRPLLRYLATWCGMADLSCIRGDAEREEVCFGEG